MKRIVSFLLALSVVFCFASVSFAATSTISVTSQTISVGAGTTSVTLNFVAALDDSYGIMSLQTALSYDRSKLTLTGYSLTPAIAGGWSNSDSNTNAAYGAYLSFDDTSYEGTSSTDTITLSLTFDVNDTEAAVYNVGITEWNFTDTDWLGHDDFTVPTATITVASSTPEPSVDTFEATTTIGNGGEAVHSTNVGGVESGSAFRIGFTIPEAATSKDAIFGITAGGDKRYSPKQIGILNGIDAGSPVVLDVSFLNGRDNSSYQSKTVTAVSVILANSDGTQFFFSDAADANAKAPVVAE